MIVVGVILFALIRMDYPIAPLVIGVILGGMFDESLRRTLFLSDGDVSVFVTRAGCSDPSGVVRGAGTVATCPCPARPQAPDPPRLGLRRPPVYCVPVCFDILPDRMQASLPLMRRQARTSLSEELGCHRFEVWTDPDRPAQVWLHEVYADRAAFELHLTTPHFVTFDAAVAPLITGKAIMTCSVAEAALDAGTGASA